MYWSARRNRVVAALWSAETQQGEKHTHAILKQREIIKWFTNEVINNMANKQVWCCINMWITNTDEMTQLLCLTGSEDDCDTVWLNVGWPVQICCVSAPPGGDVSHHLIHSFVLQSASLSPKQPQAIINLYAELFLVIEITALLQTGCKKNEFQKKNTIMEVLKLQCHSVFIKQHQIV